VGYDRATGMITCGNKKGRGDIGLLAVDASQRGQGLGAKLVRGAQRWFVQNGFGVGQVVTQGSNRAACELYARCGYRVESVEYFYHIWLK
jgi:dTDP-4-amino-4,6-dideoxy-D-galactose acyltransferase